MWRGGCIIRSRFLGKIKEAYDNNPEAREPAARRLFPRRDQEGAEGLAQRRGHRGQERHPRARVQHGAGVLRSISLAPSCRRTCSRPSAITSARTPTSAWTNRAANSSTPTGPVRTVVPADGRRGRLSGRRVDVYPRDLLRVRLFSRKLQRQRRPGRHRRHRDLSQCIGGRRAVERRPRSLVHVWRAGGCPRWAWPASRVPPS
jgi:hypothetical protein